MIVLKTEEEVKRLREAGRIASDVLMEVKEAVKIGVQTLELDHLCESLIKKRGAIPAFKGYKGFPASLCVSINSEVVHGLPGKRKIQIGDVVSLDLGVIYKGYYGDCALTISVGNDNPRVQMLIESCLSSLYAGVENASCGGRIGDISSAIQEKVESNGFSVIKELVGHGIGKNLHEEPAIPNFGKRGTGLKLEKGMVFTIEPMICMGNPSIMTLSDGWTVVTRDGGLAAHFEHMVYINENGCEIITTWKV